MASTVLVVDDHVPARQSMVDVLSAAGFEVSAVASGAEALADVDRTPRDVVVTDLQMPGMSGLEFIEHLQARRLSTQVLMVTAYASVPTAVAAMRLGAFDYLEKPFSAGRLEELVHKACDRRKLLDVSDAGAQAEAVGRADSRQPKGSVAGLAPGMIGTSPAMQELRRRITRIACTDETVLICGESGTGKELVARNIHAHSRRRSGPLVSLNCPVLSSQLMESELFGHEKGAFTGADTAREGRFELARGGTLLLDEVTEIDISLQAKLLRVLQERSFERVGSSKAVDVDVRVLATTNRDLAEEIREGRFREDLYYRLAVVPLHVPPLRERPGDVPLLIDYLLRRAAERLGKDGWQLEADARSLLTAYHWPGNVRELENIITRACVLSETDSIPAAALHPWLAPRCSEEQHTLDAAPTLSVGATLQEMERKMIEATLAHYGGHRGRSAKALGIGVRTLSGKLRAYGYPPGEQNFAKAG